MPPFLMNRQEPSKLCLLSAWVEIEHSLLGSHLFIRKGGIQFIALIQPYFTLFVGASQEALKITTNNQNKVR